MAVILICWVISIVEAFLMGMLYEEYLKIKTIKDERAILTKK